MFVAFAAVAPALARAQSASDKTAAEVLFEQGKKLMAEGKLAEACPKLAESNRLDTGVGTMLYLADCYERRGMTASAWGQFREAAAVAARNGDKREKVARQRASKLEPQLAKLVVVAEARETAGLEIRRDGDLVPPAAWGEEIPVDPGTHVLRATAPLKKPWQAEVNVTAASGVVRAVIPALDDAPQERAAPVATGAGASAGLRGADTGEGAAPSPGATQRLISYVAAGVGVVGLGTGTALGFAAKGKFDESNSSGNCAPSNQCNATGLKQRNDATGLAGAATGVFIGGAVLVAAGVALYLTAPSSPRTGWLRVEPRVGAGAAGLSIAGAL